MPPPLQSPLAVLPTLTARLYYATVVGGPGIERALDAGESLQRDAVARRAHVCQHLRAIVRDATAAVPFYRRLRAAGFDPDAIRTPEDLPAIPVVTRQMMQDAPDDFSAAPVPPGSRRNSTGGSTGTPLAFWQDPLHQARMRVDLYRGYRWCSHRPGERMLFLWGSDHDSHAHQTGLGRTLDCLGYNRQWVNAFACTPALLEQVMARCTRWPPRLVIAYTTSAWLLAGHMRAAGRRFPFLRAVQVTAELLTPTVREDLLAGFAAPVFNRYGCREVGNIAHECSAHAGLHVFEDSHVVEVVDDAGRQVAAGAPGRILVTNLTNRATPFIRYDLGDVGRLRVGNCACGRSTPQLDVTEGRIGEIVTSPSGRWIHGEFFTHLFYKVDGVRRFRVVQEDARGLRILLESAAPIDERTLDGLRRAILAAGDAAFDVTFEQMAAIPPSPSGKHRFVESRIPFRVPP